MIDHKIYARWDGPIIMIGFGSIGRGTLPLLLRHIKCDRTRMIIIDPSDDWKHIVDSENIKFRKVGLTRANHKKILEPLLIISLE